MKVILSVSLVVYKGYDDAIKAVNSIEAFTNNNISKAIYIVDNSPKETEGRDLFLTALKKYKDIEYINTGANLGFGRGHNYILSRFDSEYHAIINPDIEIKDDVFKKIIEYLNSNSDIGMCIPKIINDNDEIQFVYRRELTVFDMFIRMFCKKAFPKRIEKHTMQEQDYTKPFQVPFGQGSFLVIRSDLFKKLKGFDEKYFIYVEDADLCKRVNQVSKLMYYPDAKVIHKWEMGSHKNKTLLRYHIQSMFRYFNKWGWKFF